MSEATNILLKYRDAMISQRTMQQSTMRKKGKDEISSHKFQSLTSTQMALFAPPYKRMMSKPATALNDFPQTTVNATGNPNLSPERLGSAPDSKWNSYFSNFLDPTRTENEKIRSKLSEYSRATKKRYVRFIDIL